MAHNSRSSLATGPLLSFLPILAHLFLVAEGLVVRQVVVQRPDQLQCVRLVCDEKQENVIQEKKKPLVIPNHFTGIGTEINELPSLFMADTNRTCGKCARRRCGRPAWPPRGAPTGAGPCRRRPCAAPPVCTGRRPPRGPPP